MMKKKSSTAKLLYLIFVATLAIAIFLTLNRLWKFAERYQAGSIDTLLRQASAEISEQIGKEVQYSSVPKYESNGESSFVLSCDKQPIGRAYLAIKEMGPFSHAVYEISKLEGSLSTTVKVQEGIEVYNRDEKLEAANEESESVAAGKAELKVCTYTAEKLFSQDQISIKSPGFVQIEAAQKDGSTIIYKGLEDEKLVSKLKARAFQIGQTYSEYVSKDASWEQLSQCITANSPLRQSIPTMDVRWYTSHSAIEYKNIKCSTPIYLSDEYMIVQVSFDFAVTANATIYNAGGEVSTYPIKLTQYLHLDADGVWRLADMNFNLKFDIPMEEFTTP